MSDEVVRLPIWHNTCPTKDVRHTISNTYGPHSFQKNEQPHQFTIFDATNSSEKKCTNFFHTFDILCVIELLLQLVVYLIAWHLFLHFSALLKWEHHS